MAGPTRDEPPGEDQGRDDGSPEEPLHPDTPDPATEPPHPDTPDPATEPPHPDAPDPAATAPRDHGRAGRPTELDAADVEARWAELTERLGPLEAPPASARPSPLTAMPLRRSPPPGPRDYAPEEDDDEGFVPPEPAPAPATDPVVRLGWGLVGGAALALIVLGMFWRPMPGTVLAVLLTALLAGAAVLVWRMPGSGEDPTGRGGGAVV